MGRVVGLNEMVKESLTVKMTFGKDLKDVRIRYGSYLEEEYSKQMEQLVQNP